MGLELTDLSELEALRPIRTAVSSAARRTDDDAADFRSCCRIPPTAPTDSMAPPQQDGGVMDDSGWACGATAPRDGASADDTGACCATPTSAASALRQATVCPPAPQKPTPAKRKRPPQQRLFFPAPRDLATVFAPRVVSCDMRMRRAKRVKQPVNS